MALEVKTVIENGIFWDDINELAKEAFPPEEYLSPNQLIEMAKDDHFDFWLLLDNQKFVGFMTVLTYQNLAYLFFLAIDSKHRSKGYGGQAIKTLISLYPNKKTNCRY